MKPEFKIISDLINKNSQVLDVGCGDGILMEYLIKEKKVNIRGIEISKTKVQNCIAKGLTIIEGNAEDDLKQFPEKSFDYVILSQTLQAFLNPEKVINELLRIGKQAIVTIPNFGYWKIGLHLLLKGTMPVTKTLPDEWYNTANIHLCTIKDFVNFSKTKNFKLSKSIALKSDQKSFITNSNLNMKNSVNVMKFIKNTLDISNHLQLKAAIDFGKNKEKPEKFWTLDPIDGTKGFIRGQQYAISLAYIEENEIQLGILGCPNLNPDLSCDPEVVHKKGSLLFATKNHGAWSTDIDNPYRNLKRVRSSSELSIEQLKLCESVEAAHSRHNVTKRILNQLGVKQDSIKLDSQVKYAVVARGQGHIYLRIPTLEHYKEKIWDHTQ